MFSELGVWIAVQDGDPRVLALYNRHYSAYRYADGRRRNRCVGPGQRIVLLTEACDALFIWKKFQDASGQEGVNCAVFRNEGPIRSSLLIHAAEQWAWRRWPGARLYTYIGARALKDRWAAECWVRGLRSWITPLFSVLAAWVHRILTHPPGYCFLYSRWHYCGITQKRGLLIMEKYPTRRTA